MRTGLLICGVTLIFAALAAPTRAQETAPADAAADVQAPAQEVAIEPRARDDQIERRILEILRATGWYENPAVRVDDGVVFLDGATADAERRTWAADLARKTQDVAAVVNRIQVVDPVEWAFAPAAAELKAMGRQALRFLPIFLLAIVVLPAAWFVYAATMRGARNVLQNRVGSPLLKEVMARVIAAPILLLGLYVVLQVAGLTGLAVSLLGGAGVFGIVVGFAFRDIGENFLASLLLSIRRPFVPGELVEVAGHSGIVQSMNTRSTLLLTLEGNHVQIPNATVFKNVIVNYSTAPQRRQVLEVGIGYDVAIADAQKIVLDVLLDHPAVLKDPAPLALVDALASSTVNLKIYYWFDGRAFSQMKVKSAILRLVKNALMEAGVSMPDDAREIIFPEGVPIRQLDAPARQPPPQPQPPAEPDRDATASEGGLSNEFDEIEASAGAAAPSAEETDATNLLENKESAKAKR